MSKAFIELAQQFAAPDQSGPAAVWRHFETLCTTPRQSKREGQLRDKLIAWAHAESLATQVDAAGNLIIRKPASPGAENKPGVVLQGHIDMVCQVNQGVAHDFSRDPLKTTLKDGWLIAEQTTLGADNGLGVALALALLGDKTAVHPPIEVLLTVDEEEGMGGALGLAGDTLTGQLMLNLDTEEWGEFYIGCAGGLDVDISRALTREAAPIDHVALRLTVDGLAGGHSGCDIHLGRGNANKILLRTLQQLAATLPLRLSALTGGTARNAIPREATADLLLPAAAIDQAAAIVTALDASLRSELAGVDEGIALRLAPLADAGKLTVLDLTDQTAVLRALHAAPVGIRRMSASVAGVVETSNNLGIIGVDANGLQANLMVRSLVDSAGIALADEIASGFALAGCAVSLGGHYPSWRPDPTSALLATSRAVYAREYGASYGESKVQVIHAGLECGIIGSRYPGMQMVSFGPTIRGAHAPGERVEVASVTRCWHLLKAILAELAC